MSIDIRMIPRYIEEDDYDIILNCYRDDSTYWRLCRALESKRHGILSSYLIYKIIGTFSNNAVRGTIEEWGLEDEEVINTTIHGDILYAIAQHNFEFANLYQMNSLADLLVLADEIEEFSRYGRQMQSRKYYDTTAEVEIEFKPASNKNIEIGDDLDIIITYKVADHLKKSNLFCDFFNRKAENVCKFYSLGREDSDNYINPATKKQKFCTINSIKLIVKNEDNEVFVHIFKNEKENQIDIPGYKTEKKTYRRAKTQTC